VAYLGPVHYTKGDFAGLIVEDVSAGKNNGNLSKKILYLMNYYRII
jgi:hypothetical protein